MLKGRIGFVKCRVDDGYFSPDDVRLMASEVREQIKADIAEHKAAGYTWELSKWKVQKVFVTPFDDRWI